jgi:transposase
MDTWTLSEHERRILRELIHSESSGRVLRRAQALLWLDAGETVAAVAARLNIARQTIYNWRQEFAQRSAEPVAQRLHDEARSGRPANKMALALHWLPILLACSPHDYGYRARSWTSWLLGKQIERESHESIGLNTVRRALHALHYRFKRPRYVLARRAPNWRQSKGG